MAQTLSHLYQFRRSISGMDPTGKYAKSEILQPFRHLMQWPGNGDGDLGLPCHELGHAMVLVSQGQGHRIALPNYGWPEGEFFWFNDKTADIECLVFAFQNILISRISPDYNFERDILARGDAPGCIATARNGRPGMRHDIPMKRTAEGYNEYTRELFKKHKGAGFDRLFRKTTELILAAAKEVDKK